MMAGAPDAVAWRSQKTAVREGIGIFSKRQDSTDTETEQRGRCFNI
jgi:hypothetical protein